MLKSILYGEYCLAVFGDLGFVFFDHTIGLLLSSCLDLLFHVLLQLLFGLELGLFFRLFFLADYFHLVLCHCDLHAGET